MRAYDHRKDSLPLTVMTAQFRPSPAKNETGPVP